MSLNKFFENDPEFMEHHEKTVKRIEEEIAREKEEKLKNNPSSIGGKKQKRTKKSKKNRKTKRKIYKNKKSRKSRKRI